MNAYDVSDKVRIKGRFGTNPTHVLNEAAASSTAVTVADVTGYATGDLVILNPGMDTQELNTVNTITGRVLGMSSAWVHPHHIRERIWERTDPTVTTLKLKGPSGSTTTYTTGTLTRESAGMFYHDISLSSAGDYYYKWIGTGAAETAGEGQFVVRPSAFAT
jgi:hypothetical protein